MKRSALDWAKIAAGLGLIALSLGLATGPSQTPFERLLGPLGRPLSSIAWIRAEAAFEAGDLPLAFERAERALGFAPSDPDAWAGLVRWQGGTLASAVREGDSAQRLAWFEAGLATVERARPRARPFAPVAAAGAAICWVQSQSEPPLDWPGGAAALKALAKRYAAEAWPGADPFEPASNSAR